MLFLICENILTDSNSILRKEYKNRAIESYVSGSSSQRINGSLQLTKPEYAYDQIDKTYDWCSNCGRSSSDHPWIILRIKNKSMKVAGYYIKIGCCGEDLGSRCCCYDGSNFCYHCCLYSWSFQISNDNTTWKTIHKVEKDKEMTRCKEKTFKFSETYSTNYVRLIQDEPCPGDKPCIALNKIEIIGSVEGSIDYISEDFNLENEDDDVSIIGHISKNNHKNN